MGRSDKRIRIRLVDSANSKDSIVTISILQTTSEIPQFPTFQSMMDTFATKMIMKMTGQIREKTSRDAMTEIGVAPMTGSTNRIEDI